MGYNYAQDRSVFGWELDHKRMILRRTINCIEESIEFGRVILAVESWGGQSEWSVHSPKTLGNHFCYQSWFEVYLGGIKSVWIGEFEKGQEEISLTQICEKEIKALLQEAR